MWTGKAEDRAGWGLRGKKFNLYLDQEKPLHWREENNDALVIYINKH